MHGFSSEVVLITGAGWSPGREIALAFAARQARVAVCDLTPLNLDPIAAEVRAAGGVCEILTADVSSKIQAQTMVASILEHWGRIDVLATIIGVQPQASILDLDEWDWRKALDINLTGPFLMTQLAGRVMRELGGGSILYIADSEGESRTPEARAAFSAARAGLSGLARAAAEELKPYQIRVNALLRRPDADLLTVGTPESERLPADSETLAEAGLRLCSPEGAKITGEVVLIA
jgi:NAD(P)-dependent dehydrogenase (short-subunit alcohol dehydrogenase family)